MSGSSCSISDRLFLLKPHNHLTARAARMYRSHGSDQFGTDQQRTGSNLVEKVERPLPPMLAILVPPPRPFLGEVLGNERRDLCDKFKIRNVSVCVEKRAECQSRAPPVKRQGAN